MAGRRDDIADGPIPPQGNDRSQSEGQDPPPDANAPQNRALDLQPHPPIPRPPNPLPFNPPFGLDTDPLPLMTVPLFSNLPPNTESLYMAHQILMDNLADPNILNNPVLYQPDPPAANELPVNLVANEVPVNLVANVLPVYPARRRPPYMMLPIEENPEIYPIPALLPALNEHPGCDVVRVPASYACQQGGYDSSLSCPVSGELNDRPQSCLYVTGIIGEPLHVVYNWLVSLFRRYSGYRDVHVTRDLAGAVVGFESAQQAAVVKAALDGYWLSYRHRLHVEFVNPDIYYY